MKAVLCDLNAQILGPYFGIVCLVRELSAEYLDNRSHLKGFKTCVFFKKKTLLRDVFRTLKTVFNGIFVKILINVHSTLGHKK